MLSSSMTRFSIKFEVSKINQVALAIKDKLLGRAQPLDALIGVYSDQANADRFCMGSLSITNWQMANQQNPFLLIQKLKNLDHLNINYMSHKSFFKENKKIMSVSEKDTQALLGKTSELAQSLSTASESQQKTIIKRLTQLITELPNDRLSRLQKRHLSIDSYSHLTQATSIAKQSLSQEPSTHQNNANNALELP